MIMEHKFTVQDKKYGKATFVIVDVGGQRELRERWSNALHSFSAIIFLTAVSEYDQTLRESSETVSFLWKIWDLNLEFDLIELPQLKNLPKSLEKPKKCLKALKFEFFKINSNLFSNF